MSLKYETTLVWTHLHQLPLKNSLPVKYSYTQFKNVEYDHR